jgi:pimeloyl-ACP methyl ester carboxylesterase
VEQGLAVQQRGDPADPAILLWPGLGSTGAYFAGIAEGLPGRTVAVDPPGSGGSAPLDRYTSGALIALAASVAEAHECRAIVGHSLGAYVAVGLAADPPAGLRAAVLLDGGFMDAAAMAELGMPVTSGREQLIAWMRANRLRFTDWETATRELAGIIGGEPTEIVEAYVRDVFAEVDGEICERISPEEAADQVLAVVEHDVLSRASRVQIPTLVVASGQPAVLRAMRERAWRRFSDASPLIELQVEDAWGHNAIVQDPEASTRLIAGWLQRHL